MTCFRITRECIRGAGTDLNQGGQDPVKEKIGAKPRIFYGTYGNLTDYPPRIFYGTYGTSPTTPLEYFTEHTNIRNLADYPPSNILRNIRNLTDYPPRIFYGTYGTSPTTPLEFTRILLKERGKNVEKTWWDNFGKLLGQNKKLQGQLSQ